MEGVRFGLLLKAFTGNVVPAAAQPSLRTDNWWMLLSEHGIQPTQTSIKPMCSSNPTHVPLGYKRG